MAQTLYSHRLKALLQQTVVELGLTLTLSDATADLQLADHEAMIAELARSLKLKAEMLNDGRTTQVVFSRL